MSKPDLKNFTEEQLVDFMQSLGLPGFRGKQVFAWLYRPGITNFAQMTDLSLKIRQELAERATFTTLTPAVEEHSEDGTVKYGFKLDDGALVESVLIPEEDRNTLCVSSQVGCGMGCRFCLTGTMGFKRNLLPAEIVNQVGAVLDILIRKHVGPAEPTKRYINNLVFMGMGEPLANFDNLLIALHILTAQRGYNFSERRITVSTCGLVPKIAELGSKTNVNLAISLHAVDDATRNSLMPINATYPLDKLLAACRAFPLANRRRIMFEYILIQGLNDSERHAQMLAELLKGIRCKINLLPCNQTPDLPYKRPDDAVVERFQQVLLNAGYTVLVRSSRGGDISAACGQLAGRYESEKVS